MKKKLLFLMISSSSSIPMYSQVGINTPAPTNMLDVAGSTRVRSITTVAGSTVVTPIYSNNNGVLVKASPSTTYGGVISNNSTNISSGATGILITGLADLAIYKAVVMVGDGCANNSTAEYLISNFNANSNFGIRGLYGLLSSSVSPPTFNSVTNSSVVVTWTGKPNCSAGDDSSAFNYTITLLSTGTLDVTNNGNITKSYSVILTRIN